jgi:lipoprotein-anchoring transpeptidase ErfK/SrfK
MFRIGHWHLATAALAVTILSTAAYAAPLGVDEDADYPDVYIDQPFPGFGPPMVMPRGNGPEAMPDGRTMQDYRQDYRAAPDNSSAVVPERFRRQVVAYHSNEKPGTIIIDTPHTYLYYILGNDRAIRYGIGVGREGFTWAGVEHVARKQEWPDWHPPAEMIARQPYLPRMMAGGPGNPLGARAMYLGNSLYRIHGTNDPSTIGKRVSSGCIRLTNENVIDLFNRVSVGAKVVVLPMNGHRNPEVARTRSRTHEHISENDAPRPAAMTVPNTAGRPLAHGSAASRLY